MNWREKILKSVRAYFSGYFSARDLINLLVNQFIFQCARCYYAIRAVVRREPGYIGSFKKYILPVTVQPKRALVSFLRFPIYKIHFIGRIRFYFSTNGLVLELVRALNELGYECDIIDLGDKVFVPRRKYDMAIFHGAYNFESINPHLPSDCIRINFDTGAYWKTHNRQEECRFSDLQQRTGAVLPYDRYVANGAEVDSMLSQVDAVIALGEHYTRESYAHIRHLYTLPNGFYEDVYYKSQRQQKDFAAAKGNFLFFSGGGSVHKGLDILVEAFAGRSEHLYICTELEPGFDRLYGDRIRRSHNLHLVGYLPQRTKKFYELIHSCAWLIHPSCSEGSPGGVIDLLQYGIIPVVSRESNIDVSKFGVMLPGTSAEQVRNCLDTLAAWPNEELARYSRAAQQAAGQTYAAECFRSNIKHILTDIIFQHGQEHKAQN